MISLSTDAVATAASLVGTILLLNLFGALLALYPRGSRPGDERGMLKQNGIQSLATMAARIFLPFFIGTAVAQTKDILSLWPLLLWHMFSIPASVVISYILARICRLPRRDTMPFVASCSWGNIGALTFVFMQAACDQPALADEEDCFERASAFIGISVLAWHLTFWTIGEILLTHGAGSHTPLTAKHVLRRLFNPNIIAQVLGIIIAIVPGMADLFFARVNVDASGNETTSRAPLGFIMSGAITLGSAGVGAVTLVVAATLGKRIERMTTPVWATQASYLARSVSVAVRRNASRLRGKNGDAQPQRRLGSTLEAEEVDEGVIVSPGENSAPGSPESKSRCPSIKLSAPPDETAAVNELEAKTSQPTEAPSLFLPSYGETDVDAEVVDTTEPPAAGERVVESSRKHNEQDCAADDESDNGDSAAEAAAVASSSEPEPLAAAVPPFSTSRGSVGTVMTTLGDEENMAEQANDDVNVDAAGAGAFHLSKGRIALMVFGRVIVVGLFEFLIVFALGDYVFTGPDAPMVKLILYIQAFTPTASMAVVGCQHAGAKEAAETVAVAMVFQWLAIFVVLIFSAAVAFSLTYPES